MRRILLPVLLVLFYCSASQAQFTRYVIRLKDKGNGPYTFSNPLAYLSQRAIDRRNRYGIGIDSFDLPVTPGYITQIKNVPNVTFLNASKWLNSVTILTTDPNAITTINALPFVKSTGGIAARNNEGREVRNKFTLEETIVEGPASTSRITADYFNYGTSSFNEIHLHNGEFLHNIGLRGQGMQIALIDNGYNNYTALKAFDSVNMNGQVLGTWDFVARESNVINDGSHGMNCFSTIGANIPGQFVGKAPKASFWLYRTEDDASEYPIEEHNWVCAAERSDSSGSEVISSSLGYYDFDNATFNYVYANMNGNTTMAAIGADIAAKKGLLVFVAAGNEGTNAWHYIITPADADSVVAVGAVSITGTVGSFSSYGPSSDGQVKPDMASVGVGALIQSTGNTVVTGNGTSFACPNMAGLGTCLWQGFPEFNNMKIVQALRQASSIYSTPNDRIGYGIPNVKTAFKNLLVEYATSSATANACNVTVNWSSKDMDAMKYEIERMAPGETSYTKVGEMSPLPGAILANRSYQFTNALVNVAAGTVSYRIRQIIDTAAATFTAAYIDTANVNIAAGCFTTGTGNPNANKEMVMVQPNPVSGSSVTLVVETNYAVTDMAVMVYDAKGRLVMQLKSSKNSGRKTIDLTIDRMGKGKYYIKVFNGQKAIGTAEMLRL
jgi:serine protease AprX